jgi:hypothetical protein
MQSETTALGTLLKYACCDGPLELTADEGARRAESGSPAGGLALVEGGEDRLAEVAQEQHVSLVQLWLLFV